MNKKIEVTENYLKEILQALEDAKGYFDLHGFKNTYQKHIKRTKDILNKINKDCD